MNNCCMQANYTSCCLMAAALRFILLSGKRPGNLQEANRRRFKPHHHFTCRTHSIDARRANTFIMAIQRTIACRHYSSWKLLTQPRTKLHMSHGQNLQGPIDEEGLNCMSKPCRTIWTPYKIDNPYNVSQLGAKRMFCNAQLN